MELISWEDLASEPEKPIPFLIDPYIPQQGIVLLYGDTSIGKSPFTWAIAAAVGRGTHFFGLPCNTGRVLYLEADSPRVSAAPRIRLVKETPPNVWFGFTGPLSVPNLSSEALAFLDKCQEEVNPDLVIMNTLRNAHDGDDKLSETPKLVYSFFRRFFKQAALMFVHHTKKSPVDPRQILLERESFSGSKAWLNDAQVGLHLGTFESDEQKINLRLMHVKSQVTERVGPLGLRLEPDGTTIKCPEYEQLLRIYELMNGQPELPVGELDSMVAKEFGVGPKTIERRRKLVETHKFPGSHSWLGRSKG